MERILGILTRQATARAVLAACRHLLDRLPGSRLSLLHPRPDVDPSFLPTEEIMTDDRRREFEARQDRVTAALQRDVAAWSPPAPHRAATLRQVAGKPSEVVVAEAANADLVVLGGAGSGHDAGARAAIDAALFKAASPVVLVPERVPATLGRHVVVAWEPSRAADGAVGAALPLLLAADGVTVLMAEEGESGTALPAGLMRALGQQGRAVQVRRFGLGGRAIGAALLAEAHGAGADLLVMGAFAHNRTMEAIFGGATREVLAGADLPLLMHH